MPYSNQTQSRKLKRYKVNDYMVTWLLLKGSVRKEIAKLLLIAEDTVAEHIQAIFKHFGVRSTVDLVLKIYR